MYRKSITCKALGHYEYLILILRAMYPYRLDYISKVPHNSKISLCFSPKRLNTQAIQKTKFEHLTFPNGRDKVCFVLSQNYDYR